MWKELLLKILQSHENGKSYQVLFFFLHSISYQEEEEKNFITGSFTVEKGEKMIAIKVHVTAC
jgi:hypothetical protein